MEVNTIAARDRPEIGSPHVARIREQGDVPCVVYGMGRDPQHITVDGIEFGRELRRRHRVFKLSLDGNLEPVFLQDVQLDTLTDLPLHVDFMRIDLDKSVSTEVELAFVGLPVGQAKGGALVRNVTRLKINAQPDAIPIEIEIKVGGVDLGGQIIAKEVELPAGVTLNQSEDTIICHMAE